MKKQYRYINDFNKQNYDKISVMLPKGRKEYIKRIASERGESVNSFVNKLLQNESNMTESEWKTKAV